MQESYQTAGKETTVFLTEKKSEFIGDIKEISSEKDALLFIAEKKKKYHDARHHCFAYILRETGVKRYSDDGEPQGTAGMPILEVMQKEGLIDCVLVVTRYFGGTLLGAGPLLRAYAKCAKAAIEKAGVKEYQWAQLLSAEIGYDRLRKMQNLTAKHGGKEECVEYGERIAFTALFPFSAVEDFLYDVKEAFAGDVDVEESGKCFVEKR